MVQTGFRDVVNSPFAEAFPSCLHLRSVKDDMDSTTLIGQFQDDSN